MLRPFGSDVLSSGFQLVEEMYGEMDVLLSETLARAFLDLNDLTVASGCPFMAGISFATFIFLHIFNTLILHFINTFDMVTIFR